MKPNIIFLLVDSLRADRFSGPLKTSKTPNIDKLIKNGTYFEQAISSASSTAQSIGTICTGMYPFKTGITGKSYRDIKWNGQSYFDDLKKEGYTVYASAPEFAENFGLKSNFKKKYENHQSSPMLWEGLGEDMINLLESQNMKEPWFSFLHILDLHYLVWLPEEFNKKEFGITPYDKMMSAIDVWIGKIIEKIDLKNTLIIITSDHGEYIPDIKDKNLNVQFEQGKLDKILWKIGSRTPSSLMLMRNKAFSKFQKIRKKRQLSSIDIEKLSPYQKRGYLGARGEFEGDQHIFDELLRVPLLFTGPNMPKNKTISTQVRHVDIFPTIGEIINLKKESAQVDGESLIPLMHDKQMNEEYAYFESVPGISKEKEQIFGIRTRKYKFSKSKNSKSQIKSLYNLQSDPLEEENIAAKFLDIVKKMEAELEKIYSNKIDDNEKPISKDELKKIENELKKMGYI
jgi:arylsulfatase A-like enzyme